MTIDPFLDEVEEWVDRSGGRVRADVVHEKLAAMGFAGSERTTRRAVAAAKKTWRTGHRRIFRPWCRSRGLWLQFDWGYGPRVEGRATLLFCAWLAWSRFRVVLPVWDRTPPSLLACLDTTPRTIGGAPTYALTDNEKTVTVEHVARVPVRHPDIVAAGRHYGMTIRTCVPADPQTKGGTFLAERAEAGLTLNAAGFDGIPITGHSLRAGHATTAGRQRHFHRADRRSDPPPRPRRRLQPTHRPAEALAASTSRGLGM